MDYEKLDEIFRKYESIGDYIHRDRFESLYEEIINLHEKSIKIMNINKKIQEVTQNGTLQSGEEIRYIEIADLHDIMKAKCTCKPDQTTGTTMLNCCNICGKQTDIEVKEKPHEDYLSKIDKWITEENHKASEAIMKRQESLEMAAHGAMCAYKKVKELFR